jgi:hypothetical protein
LKPSLTILNKKQKQRRITAYIHEKNRSMHPV